MATSERKNMFCDVAVDFDMSLKQIMQVQPIKHVCRVIRHFYKACKDLTIQEKHITLFNYKT